MNKVLLILMVLTFGLTGCEDTTYIPKPTGYSRIDFPEHKYQLYMDESCPYAFEYGEISEVVVDSVVNESRCWFNIEYPKQKAKIHFTYYDLEGKNVGSLMEDTRILAMKHLAQADDFEESVVSDDSARVFGVIYDFQGSTASNLQFYLTDSTNHFIRGALYFEVVPQADSLAPSEKYIEEELMHVINTFRWK